MYNDIERIEQEALHSFNGDPQDIALALYRASVEPYRQGNYPVSLALLERALALHPQHAPSYWMLAEVLRERSVQNGTNAMELIEQSLTRWNQGCQLRPVDADTAWVYITRARINEQLAHVTPERVEQLWWEAVFYMERCLTYHRYGGNAMAYAYLSRCYRHVGCTVNATLAIETAISEDPTDPTVISERSQTLPYAAGGGQPPSATDELKTLLARPEMLEKSGGWARMAVHFALSRLEKEERPHQ